MALGLLNFIGSEEDSLDGNCLFFMDRAIR